MGWKFNPFTGNLDRDTNPFTPDPLVVDNLTVNTLATINHIHGNIAGSLYVHVKNTSDSVITKGTPLYVTGAVGDTTTLEVAAADSANVAKMPAFALAGEQIAVNGMGHAVMFGELTGASTDSYAINDELFVAGGGGLTNTKPTTGTAQSVAVVGRVHVTTGTLLVWVAGPTN